MTGKGIVTAADITGHIEELESYGSRGLGPRVIARAWSDPEFKKRLLEDGVAGVTELGVEAGGWKPYGGVTGTLHIGATLIMLIGRVKAYLAWLP